ncbi:hypothetical protein ACLBX9_19565 [Methylobacterium sp. A49B]|uniref:Uncharacterized protein n=1 Tax=Methylobacterium mesophilicum SR1.6/6 TaxID=908290 RepID=A0A6B9FZC8_9HYPH|nr:hypothetical protein [Methylobacterium mesophilicum]QGY05688.1 hypothetical protein MMSR116_30165 [Methylobacterium mesophilicum SR1.6/6]
MNLCRDRILDRLWLALSGAAALSAALQAGAQIGARPCSSGGPFLAAQATASDMPARTALSAAGCRDAHPGGLR